MAMATKRAIATVTRAVGNKEDTSNGGKRNGNGKEGGR